MKKNKNLPVAIIQQKNSVDTNNNLSLSLKAIRKAAAKGAKLILLQELHSLPYFCQTENSEHFNFAESIPGPTTDTLSTLAKELGLVIVGSLFERRAAGLYHNTAIIIDSDGALAGVYRKMHIPDDPGFFEKYYFTPGDNNHGQGFKPVATSVGKLGVLICWDQWYPEAARLMTLAGADLLLYPTAIGWDPDDSKKEKEQQLDAWLTIQRSHAIANGLPILVANRCGHEIGYKQGIEFWGNSFIAGQQGEILAKAENQAEVLIAELSFSRTEKIRQMWPFLRDRRIDAYEEITKRWIDTPNN